MKAKILKRHFDRAVKHNWDTRTCLVAQFAMENGLSVGKNGQMYAVVHSNNNAWDAMRTFDSYFKSPGDERRPELQALRASLPIEVEIT